MGCVAFAVKPGIIQPINNDTRGRSRTSTVGPTLFVGCAIGKVTMEEVSKELWPFYGAIRVALLLVTYIHAISLWLPGLTKL